MAEAQTAAAETSACPACGVSDPANMKFCMDCGAQKNLGNPALVAPTVGELKIFIENLESANDAKYKDINCLHPGKLSEWPA
jgi:hypothetical protein